MWDEGLFWKWFVLELFYIGLSEHKHWESSFMIFQEVMPVVILPPWIVLELRLVVNNMFHFCGVLTSFCKYHFVGHEIDGGFELNVDFW